MSDTVTLTAEQYVAILASHDALAVERDSLMGKSRPLLKVQAGLRSKLPVATTERDLYHERPELFQRRLLAVKSEMRDAHQQDLIFNKAEVLAPNAVPVQASVPDSMLNIPAHKQIQRGRKPLDPALPRMTVCYGLSKAALAWRVAAKFADGLPLYRLAVVPRRTGSNISRGTLAANLILLGQAVQPLNNLIRDILLESYVVYGNETIVQVLKRRGRRAQARSFVWAQMNGIWSSRTTPARIRSVHLL